MLKPPFRLRLKRLFVLWPHYYSSCLTFHFEISTFINTETLLFSLSLLSYSTRANWCILCTLLLDVFQGRAPDLLGYFLLQSLFFDLYNPSIVLQLDDEFVSDSGGRKGQRSPAMTVLGVRVLVLFFFFEGG